MIKSGFVDMGFSVSDSIFWPIVLVLAGHTARMVTQAI